MDERSQSTVVAQMSAICRDACQSGVPLILLNTQERELAKRIVLSGELVELYEEALPESTPLSAYYRYLSDGSRDLARCSNFFEDVAALQDFLRKPEGRLAPLFLLHLRRSTSAQYAALLTALQDYAAAYRDCTDLSSPLRRSCVLLYGDVGLLPAYLLQPYTKIVEEPFPKVWEISQTLQRMAAAYGKPFEHQSTCQEIAVQLAGFRVMQVERVIESLLWTDAVNGNPRLFDRPLREQTILREKAQVLLQNASGLQLVQSDARAKDQLRGMGAYQVWITRYLPSMARAEDFAFERGVMPLKGLLMCGVPGCGKSEAAKLLQRSWNLPLVKLSMQQLMGGHVGDSERNLRTALAQAEAMAPCIVWIEEIENAMGGMTSGSGDSGTSQRMLELLLTWLQDKTRACFVFATANDISKLPYELLRKGRFDELCGVTLPTRQECMDILAEQMHRAEDIRVRTAKDRGQTLANPRLFEDSCYSDETRREIVQAFADGNFLTGADIQVIVTDALRTLDDALLAKPLSDVEWKNAIAEVSKGFISFGGSYDTLNRIAVCYLRLLRGNFAPVSGADQQLFQRQLYQVEYDGTQVSRAAYTGTADTLPQALQNDYDRGLFSAILRLINGNATRYETLAAEKEWTPT